jgi:DNA-directed RNA polymerase subunit K/omega
MPPKKTPAKKSKKKDEEEYTPEIEVEEDKIEDTEDYIDEEELEEEEDEEDEEEEEEDLVEDGKECLIEKVVDEDNEYFDNDEYVEVQPDTTVEYVKKEERISAKKLTKYEMVRILGERQKQLTMGAKPLIKNFQGLSYDKIAEEELKLNMIPFKIRRPLPNGKYELWTLDELNKTHLLYLLD